MADPDEREYKLHEDTSGATRQKRAASKKKERLTTEATAPSGLSPDARRTAVEDVIHQYFKYNSSPTDIDSLVSIVTDDIVAIYPSRTCQGKAEYQAHVNGTFISAAKFLRFNRVRAKKIVIQDDKAIVRWRFQYKTIVSCSMSELDGYNEYQLVPNPLPPSADDKQPYSPFLIKMVRTETIQSPAWYVTCCKPKSTYTDEYDSDG